MMMRVDGTKKADEARVLNFTTLAPKLHLAHRHCTVEHLMDPPQDWQSWPLLVRNQDAPWIHKTFPELACDKVNQR